MFKLIHKRVPSNAKNDILSGLTVALALVPEAVAFALLAGLNPLVGLYAAFTIGLITSISCQIGDLFFSFLKRKSSLKDTGNFLPGHGGVLDRIDGMLLDLSIGLLSLLIIY